MAIRYTVCLYLYDEPVLETYWTDYVAAVAFCEKVFKRAVVQKVCIWLGEAPGPDYVDHLHNPDLLYHMAKS
jgi:hypothetical protein